MQQVANNKTDDYIVQVVDNLIRLPKISEADLDKAEREIRALEMLSRKYPSRFFDECFSGGFSHFEVEDILLMPFKNIAAKRAGS